MSGLRFRWFVSMNALIVWLLACAGPTDEGAIGGDSRSDDRGPDAASSNSVGGPVGPERVVRSTDAVREAPEMANPADVKCVEEGYQLQYVREDGIPIKGLCVNERTGAKCESWAFYRGECSLGHGAAGR